MPLRTRSTFDLSIHAEAGRAMAPYLRRHLRSARRLLRQSRLQELSVALVGDRRMSELHQQFMNIPGPTDVLTFPLDLDGGGRAMAGEVVVCVPEARRRARDQGVPVERELLLYALHGMLHLSGFDDRTDRDYQRMHRTEDRILTQLGIGPTFRPDNSASAAPMKQSARRSGKAAGVRRRASTRRGGP